MTVDYSLKELAVAKRHNSLRSFTTVSRLSNEPCETFARHIACDDRHSRLAGRD